MAQFVDCQFQSCGFNECTGEHVSFTATEIDPTALLTGMVAPHYNYDSSYDGELRPEQLDKEWLEIRRFLAAQVLKSNAEIYHTDNSDRALAELKLAELNARRERLASETFRAGMRFWVRERIHCTVLWLILLGSRGGTSIGRLFFLAAGAISFYAALLSMSSVEFQGTPCTLMTLTIPGVVEQLARATSLFLAIGYTAFKGATVLQVVLLTVGATIGLIWYALIAAVVIRRVYR
jgi:hypothetical protein